MSVRTTGIAIDNGGQITYRRFDYTYAEIAAIIGAATSGNVPLFTTTQASLILFACVKHTAQFVFSGGAGTFKCSIGSAASATLLTAASADLVATAVGDTAYTASTGVVQWPGTRAALAIVANCVSSVANVNTLTAGAVSFYVAFANVTTPSA